MLKISRAPGDDYANFDPNPPGSRFITWSLWIKTVVSANGCGWRNYPTYPINEFIRWRANAQPGYPDSCFGVNMQVSEIFLATS